MNIAVVGLSHKTATVEIREKLSIPEARVESAIAQLNSLPSIEECAILSTCNRLELYVVTRGTTENGIREITQFLSEFSQLPLQFLRRHLFILLRQDAVMHLLRVAAGLDSLVLGEGQILAQVKHTHRLAQQHGGSGRILNQLFKQALSAGKDVRTKTDIGTGAVSISSAAVELAQMKLQTLAHQRVAILGAGKMSRLLVKHLVSKGATKISIINRSIDRAQDLVNEFRTDGVDFQIHPFEHLHSCVGISDLVFTSTASTEVLLARHHLEPFMTTHPGLMLVDISVPRNIHADVNELPNVNAFNVDDLEAVVAGNQESRRQMALQAEFLLEESFLDFDAWWRSLDTVPTINKLRQKMEVIREQELEKALSRLGSEFAEKHQDVIENLTRGIINKILHDPMVQLRAQQDIETRKRAMQTLQMLFDLDAGNKQAI